MYNEEQKLRFLDTVESASSRKAITNAFNRFEEFEIDSGMDIAAWGDDKIYNAISTLCVIDYGTIKQYISFINAYREFLSLAPTFLDASRVDLTSAIRKTIIPSPVALKMELSKIRELDQGHYGVAAACFAWLGIDMETMPLIKDSAVNFERRTIFDQECDIEIDDIDTTIISLLKEYWETEEAIRWHNTACKVYAIHNGRFLHIFAGSNSKKQPRPISYDGIRQTFRTLAQDAKKDEKTPSIFTYSNLVKSGTLYNLYCLEQQGTDIANRKSGELMKKAYSTPGKDYDIRALYRQYKKAFDLD